MTSPVHRRADAEYRALLADASMDMQWKEIGALQRLRPIISPGIRLHVGFLDSEDMAKRVATVRAITQSGFVAVPIIAARRLDSEGDAPRVPGSAASRGRDAEPDRFIQALAADYDAALHGEVHLHFNTFGGITRTANWINQVL